ncbi:hypothetical protein TB2_033682 [Malus domestica]
MDDSIVKDVVNAHNQLFGSCNLVLAPGTFHVSDLDKTLSFTDSHTLGVGMIKGQAFEGGCKLVNYIRLFPISHSTLY